MEVVAQWQSVPPQAGMLGVQHQDGGCSSKVERLFVEQKVAGALPVSHPEFPPPTHPIV